MMFRESGKIYIVKVWHIREPERLEKLLLKLLNCIISYILEREATRKHTKRGGFLFLRRNGLVSGGMEAFKNTPETGLVRQN
jgi:hypothetical protein